MLLTLLLAILLALTVTPASAAPRPAPAGQEGGTNDPPSSDVQEAYTSYVSAMNSAEGQSSFKQSQHRNEYLSTISFARVSHNVTFASIGSYSPRVGGVAVVTPASEAASEVSVREWKGE